MSIRQRYLDLSLGAVRRADHRVFDGLESFIASVLFLIRLSRT